MTDAIPRLKPCPFCGSSDVDPEGWASATRKGPCCDGCGAAAETVYEWNTRAREQALQVALEYMVAQHDRNQRPGGGDDVPSWVRDALKP